MSVLFSVEHSKMTADMQRNNRTRARGRTNTDKKGNNISIISIQFNVTHSLTCIATHFYHQMEMNSNQISFFFPILALSPVHLRSIRCWRRHGFLFCYTPNCVQFEQMMIHCVWCLNENILKSICVLCNSMISLDTHSWQVQSCRMLKTEITTSSDWHCVIVIDMKVEHTNHQYVRNL